MDSRNTACGGAQDAPRITKDVFEANIVHYEILKHVTHSGQILRWAILTTKSGFSVTGRPSASVCAENDNAAIGEQVALDNARSELWPLMGYALREQMHQRAQVAAGLDLGSDRPLAGGAGCAGDACESCQ